MRALRHPGHAVFMMSTGARWNAVMARNRDASGEFVYAVRTTGVYCRPGCGSRLPLPENVSYFDTPEAAAAAGFRACRRCAPDAPLGVTPQHDALERARLMLLNSPESKLESLAWAAGLSKFHFHKTFRKAYGITPAQYARQAKLETLRRTLRSAASVTEAVYEAGFNSSAPGYEASVQALGMTPGEYRRSASGLTIEFATAPCSLGIVLAAWTARGICSVSIGDSPMALETDLHREFSKAKLRPGARDRVIAIAAAIHDPASQLKLEFDVHGTEFQRLVWNALRQIQPGSTMSYATLAQSLGRPSAARAVARACATNPVAVLVPCHRIVRTDGGISGYRWGVERKRLLLEREAAIPQPRQSSGEPSE